MKREQRITEATVLKDMCLMIFGDGPFTPGIAATISAAKDAAEAGNVRGLRQMLKRCLEVTTALPEEARLDLDRRLREQFGRGLVQEKEERLKTIGRVRRRGTIRTEEEYGEVERYIDELIQESGDSSLKAELEALLSQGFQKRAR